ncbi:hypothetical protein DVA86_12420 [Streptomyces armeniacus]|uniref:Uncharacterized protein n=1 Tax=Streptomyces armeniacus TaxID=83291 RepID=A0A345XNX4_9ACTN|nr:DUF5995 family protein [Streptomyces armeniacus]AXK33340.1 hypothetical protein DVA86_12420 [Streptomyces armeniacus]
MTSAEQLPVQHAVNADWVVRRMRALGAILPPEDGVAVFNRVYLSVTEELRQRLERGHFEDRTAAAAGELGVRFAERYLAAVDAAAAGHRTPACWRPLFQLRRHPAVRPLQFALAGINAHVGHDLPLALLDVCGTRGTEPVLLEGAFDQLGELLTGLEERIRDELLPGPDVLDVTDPLTHLAGSWSLEMARDSAWAGFRALWGLRGHPELAAELAERLGANVGMAGRCLLTPLRR